MVQKQTLWNYQVRCNNWCRYAAPLTILRACVQREKGRPFLKITLALPNMISVARGVLEKGMVIPGLSSTPLVLPTFESNVLFILRFMVDCKVRSDARVLLCWSSIDAAHATHTTGDRWKLGPASRGRLAARQAACVDLPGVATHQPRDFAYPETHQWRFSRSSRSTSCTTGS